MRRRKIDRDWNNSFSLNATQSGCLSSEPIQFQMHYSFFCLNKSRGFKPELLSGVLWTEVLNYLALTRSNATFFQSRKIQKKKRNKICKQPIYLKQIIEKCLNFFEIVNQLSILFRIEISWRFQTEYIK